jgi:arabinogalactan oligomer/maltooligosaccharide transport system permease protein
MIILYWVFKEIFNLQGTYWSLVIIYSAAAGGGCYISKGFFDTISKSIDEAAMSDGASRARIFFSIILPLAKPIVIYTILTAFMGPWGEYITSSYIIGVEVDQFTVPMGLYKMVSDFDLTQKYYTQYAAGSVCISLPISILFFCLQKYYVSGVTGGAVKG